MGKGLLVREDHLKLKGVSHSFFYAHGFPKRQPSKRQRLLLPSPQITPHCGSLSALHVQTRLNKAWASLNEALTWSQSCIQFTKEKMDKGSEERNCFGALNRQGEQ